MLLIGRFSMLVGWWHLFKDIFTKKKVSDEFVSYNARSLSEPDPSYEMLDSRKTEHGGSMMSPTTPSSVRPPPSIHKTGTPKSYQMSRSSMMSSIPGSPENNRRTTEFSAHFSPYLYKGKESEGEFVHHGLSPKPESTIHAR